MNRESQIEERLREIQKLRNQESALLGTLSEEELILYLESVYNENRAEIKNSKLKIVGGKKDEC